MTQPHRIDPSILSETLTRLRAAGSGGVAVFDLDSTLLDNRPRQARILREFGELHGLAPLTAARPEHWTSWDLAEAMRNAGLPAEEVLRHQEEAKAFWRERFFTSEYCAIDEAITGARDFLLAVAQLGAKIAYCTGRHEEMRAGTIDSFRRLGFPLPDGPVVLLMKPNLEMSDDDWKVEAYDRLRAFGQVVAVFDNEPTHINGYRNAFPDALAVHVATDHSGRPVHLLPGIISIRDFTLP